MPSFDYSTAYSESDEDETVFYLDQSPVPVLEPKKVKHSSFRKKKKKRDHRSLKRSNSDSTVLHRKKTELSQTDLARCKDLFDSLDESKTGFLKKRQLVKMLKNNLAENNLSVNKKDLESITDLMLLTSTRNKKKGVDFKAFTRIYRQYILDNNSESDSSSSNTLTSSRSSVAVLLKKHSSASSASNQLAQDRSIKPINEDQEDFVALEEDSYWLLWYHNNAVWVWWLFIYAILNIASFIWKYDRYCNRRPAAFALSGTGLCVARGMAQVCLLNAGLILLPVCRSFLDFLRRCKRIAPYIPFDNAIEFHKICGYVFVIAGLIHTIGQLVSYIGSVQPASDAIWNASALAASGAFPNGAQPSIGDLLVTIPGWTGVILTLASIIATPFTFKAIRKSKFEWFWYSHLLYYPIYMGFTWFHGIQSWLEPSQAWIFTTIPILMFTIDRWNKVKLYTSSKTNVRIRNVEIVEDTVNLTLEIPSINFNHKLNKPGTYILLNVPEISKFEWHPFTLTSAPQDDFISVNIRNSGDWTGALYELMRTCQKAGSFPIVKVDGPVGAPAQDYLNYDVVLMIGAGIGVTPFASILRDAAYRLQSSSSSQKLYFHWTTKSQKSLSWFSNSMNRVAELDTEGNIEIHNHLSSVTKASSVNVKLAQTLVHSATGRDLISGLKTRTKTHFGRPNWSLIFNDLVRAHPNTTVGVFYCGPPSLQKVLEASALDYSTNSCGTIFEFHAENF